MRKTISLFAVGLFVLAVSGTVSAQAQAKTEEHKPNAEQGQQKSDTRPTPPVPPPTNGAKVVPNGDKSIKPPEGAHKNREGIVVPPSYVKGAPQLRMMFLDRKLFEPNKWWSYEEADPDRPSQFSVEQETKVSLGSRFEPNHGAQVKYLVREFPNAGEAHKFFANAAARMKEYRKSPGLKIKGLKRGNEGILAEDTILAQGVAQAFSQRSFVRFDQYVIEINGNSNMRALGPRPEQGERKWLSEPVYAAVFDAAMTRWVHHKILLTATK